MQNRDKQPQTSRLSLRTALVPAGFWASSASLQDEPAQEGTDLCRLHPVAKCCIVIEHL
jgi:hypothetical protein